MSNNNEIWLKPSNSSLSLKQKIKLSSWLFVQKYIFKFIPHKLNSLRIIILKLFGAKIGKNNFIHQSANIYMPWNLKMGNNSSIDFDAIIYSWDKVIIGDFVSISYKVNINTATHDYTDPYFKLITKPIYIEDGVFIGTESYISLGVTLGRMSVIGARSVVVKNTEPSYIYIGHPCRKYKKREEQK